MLAYATSDGFFDTLLVACLYGAYRLYSGAAVNGVGQYHDFENLNIEWPSAGESVIAYSRRPVKSWGASGEDIQNENDSVKKADAAAAIAENLDGPTSIPFSQVFRAYVLRNRVRLVCVLPFLLLLGAITSDFVLTRLVGSVFGSDGKSIQIVSPEWFGQIYLLGFVLLVLAYLFRRYSKIPYILVMLHQNYKHVGYDKVVRQTDKNG